MGQRSNKVERSNSTSWGRIDTIPHDIRSNLRSNWHHYTPCKVKFKVESLFRTYISGFDLLKWIWPPYTGFNLCILDLTSLYWIWPPYTGFNLLILDSTSLNGLDLVILDSTSLYNYWIQPYIRRSNQYIQDGRWMPNSTSWRSNSALDFNFIVLSQVWTLSQSTRLDTLSQTDII